MTPETVPARHTNRTRSMWHTENQDKTYSRGWNYQTDASTPNLAVTGVKASVHACAKAESAYRKRRAGTYSAPTASGTSRGNRVQPEPAESGSKTYLIRTRSASRPGAA